jgi:hypothetical protein
MSVVLTALVSPVHAASAASVYDTATLSSLRNMVNAMEYYALLGPTRSYEGVSAAQLRDQGWSPTANVKYDVWVEGTGRDYRATAQDIRNGTQYSFATAGDFNGRPARSVGASSPQPALVPTAAGFVVNGLDGSLDVDALAASLAAGGISVMALCDATVFMPGTHQAGSSVTDQTLACKSAASAAGASIKSVLLALRGAGGAAALALIAAQFVGAGTTTATKPGWVDSPDPRPTTGAKPPATLPPLWRVPKSAPQFAAENAISDALARQVLTQCYYLVASTGLYGDPYDECKERPIFASGRSDTPEATDHDLEGLIQNPSWIQLDYRPAAENPSPRNWYAGSPECADPAAGTSCDEYPFFATEQGGSFATPLPSLKLIDGAQNQAQGVNYNSFLAGCHLYGKPAGERAFLAVPLPETSVGVPTLALCNGN